MTLNTRVRNVFLYFTNSLESSSTDREPEQQQRNAPLIVGWREGCWNSGQALTKEERPIISWKDLVKMPISARAEEMWVHSIQTLQNK